MITLEQIPDEVVDAADHLDNTRLIIAAALNKWIEIGEISNMILLTEVGTFPALILRLKGEK